MTVFVAHAPADLEAAEALERIVERRGLFCELDDGQTALRPIQANDVLVLLLSKDFAFATTRLRLEQRALDAWADGRLIVVKLDQGLAPVGLRDLPAIDASFEAQRELKWQEVADAIRTRLTASATGSEPAQAPLASAKRGGFGRIAILLVATPGLVAGAALVSIWLANRIGPTPGGWVELRAGVDQFGTRFGAPPAVTEWTFAIAIALTLGAFVLLAANLASRVRAAEPRAQTPAPAAATTDAAAMFVSYARANASMVVPVVEAAQREGRKFWLDQRGIVAGDGWAGEIVRAIRGAEGVMVMCSKAAFESDHVKREIYLADRYSKKLVPVFIEQADPPEDFEYFFAGVQSLNLFDTPEADRTQALVSALGAAA
jgi:TIR domain